MAFKEALKNAKKSTSKSKGSKGQGFKAAVKNVQRGSKKKLSKEEASAIVAAASRNASAAAKRRNPNLKKVK